MLDRSLRNYEAAAKSFEAAHLQQPDNPSYLGNLVESLAMQEDYELAIEKAQSYLAIYGRHPYPLFRYAEPLNDAYRYDEAIALLQESLAESPEETDFASQLARAYFLKSDYQACIDKFTTDSYPFEPDASFFYYLGRCQLRVGDTVNALASLSQAANLHPDSLFYQSWKTLALVADRQLAEAFSSASAFADPENEYASRLAACLIVAHQHASEHREAKKLLAAQLKRCVEDEDATRDFVLACLELKQYPLVEQVIERRLRKNGPSASDLTCLARSHYEQDDYEGAINFVQKALALEADYESAAFHHLHALVKLDRLPEAQSFLATWQQSHGNSARLRSALGSTILGTNAT